MTDEAKALVDRLRDDLPQTLIEKHWVDDHDAIYKQREEAADLIETQAREIERLREALKPFTFRDDGDDEIVFRQHPSIIVRCEATYGDIQLARAALAGDSHD